MAKKFNSCTIIPLKADIKELRNKESIFIEIDGNSVLTLNSFYSLLKKELKFPPYFRKNLDSLDECLCDLSWLNESKIIFLFTHFDNLLLNDKKNAKFILLQLLYECTQYWKNANKNASASNDKLIEINILIEETADLRSDLDENDIHFTEWNES